jgi:hypothetical protein
LNDAEAEADRHEDATIAIAHDEVAAEEDSDGKRSAETMTSGTAERRD